MAYLYRVGKRIRRLDVVLVTYEFGIFRRDVEKTKYILSRSRFTGFTAHWHVAPSVQKWCHSSKNTVSRKIDFQSLIGCRIWSVGVLTFILGGNSSGARSLTILFVCTFVERFPRILFTRLRMFGVRTHRKTKRPRFAIRVGSYF